MKRKKIEDLGPRQLWFLRKDIIINSIYLNDYINRYGVTPSEVYNFFMGWLDFLEEIIKEDNPNYKDDLFWKLFPKYDTPKNLLNWWFCWVG